MPSFTMTNSIRTDYREKNIREIKRLGSGVKMEARKPDTKISKKTNHSEKMARNFRTLLAASGMNNTSFNANVPRKKLPEIGGGRDFLVTHKSDNWKKRKAEMNKSSPYRISEGDSTGATGRRQEKQDGSLYLNHAPRKVPEGKVRVTPNIAMPRKPQSEDIIMERHKSSVSGMMQRIGDREKTILQKLDSSQQSLSKSSSLNNTSRHTVPSKNIPGNKRAGFSSVPPLHVINEGEGNDDESVKDLPESAPSTHRQTLSNHDEGFDDGETEFSFTNDSPAIRDSRAGSKSIDGDDDIDENDDAFNDNDEESSGFHETSPVLRKPLASDDFDTDLSESDSDSDGDRPLSHIRSRTRNRTLEAYKSSCSRCHQIPNPTFLRQCGRPSLDIRNRMLTCRDAKPISIALVHDKRTSFFDMSNNPLGPLGTAYIAEMLYVNKSIVELNLSETKPGYDGISALAQTLKSNKTLRRLYLQDNDLGIEDGDNLAKLVTTVPDLRELYLNNNNLGFSATRKIALALASNRGKLAVLDLQYNNIRTDSAVQLALSLIKNTTLRSLNVAWNGFGVDGCRALAASLVINKSLQDLDLTCNRLGLKSLGFLIKGVSKNSGLRCMKVASNPMTTEGAKALVQAVGASSVSTLTELDMRGIPIDEEFLELTLKLQEKRALRVLHDPTVHMATTDQTREHDGNNLDRFDPVTVLFEYMKKDNLRVIDLFQFFDVRKRDKLSKGDLRDGLNILMIPFTEHAIDVIMKTLDTDKDGFITLEEMMKGYRDNDRAVKLRRIKASQKKKPDMGLEDLWKILKEIIEKRKAENEKRKGGGQGGMADSGARQRRMSRIN